ncbi:hypothetical protein MHU86_1205 [Fragilaria crotonensis]|nr:hypothetical protein MHU86_1205 [Fragilaria crotonensis]
MTRNSHVTTFGPRYRWNNPSDLMDITHQLRDRFDLETGFHKECGIVHDGHESDAHGSCGVTLASCHRVVTPNGTPPSAVVRDEVRKQHEWVQQDPSPTSVQSDLVFTKGVVIPPKSQFFPFDTNDALVLQTHVDALARDLDHVVDNKQSLHDDEWWIRLEEGLHICGDNRVQQQQHDEKPALFWNGGNRESRCAT